MNDTRASSIGLSLATWIWTGSRLRMLDGFSIGSNDLTQLTIGVHRDSDELACTQLYTRDSLADPHEFAILVLIEINVAKTSMAKARCISRRNADG